MTRTESKVLKLFTNTYPEGSAPAPCQLLTPTRQHVPFVFSSPHSGRYYPVEFLQSCALDNHAIRHSEDFLVDQLFHCAVESGAPLLCANYARAFIDVNREAYELDPKMFSGKLPTYANTSSLRVAGGLGTIAKIVSERQEIYRDKLDVNEALVRIDTIYTPYHRALRECLANTFQDFGFAILIDCHSMPSSRDHNHRSQRPDFIIGDRYGTSAAGDFVALATELLRDLGYHVEVNKPYAGGYITQYYGRPKECMHALQIEINRGLYMDEHRLEANEGFAQLSENLKIFVHQLIMGCHVEPGTSFPLAAE